MQFENSFEVPASIDAAWPLLLDVRKIAPCLPGAELTEVLGDNRYKGRARVKVGPIELAFSGEAELRDVDDASHTARVVARGTEGKGRGNASATVVFRLEAAGASSTRVTAVTDLQLVGAVAQYGRGVGLIREIANQLTAQFAQNLRGMIAASDTAPAEGNATGGQPASAAAPAPQAISGLALLWAALTAMVARWLGRKGSAA